VKSSHVIFSVAAALILGVTAYTVIGQADGPTRLTNSEGLKAQRLPGPTGATAMSVPGNPQDDAAVYYERAISLYDEKRSALPDTREHDELVAELCGLLQQAANAGHIDAGFMDSHIPVEIGAEPDFGDAVEAVYELAIYQSAYRYTHADPQGARDIAVAVWVFGQRMFEHNSRLYNRNTGLDMMESAGSMLYQMAADDPTLDTEALRDWSQAINTIRQSWQPKLEVVLGLAPPIGDLVNIALNDGDRMFRIKATLRLGVHKHASISWANRRAIQSAIQSAIDSDDPMLAQAGRAADAMTLKQKRRLY
jgi:hypothetical protein